MNRRERVKLLEEMQYRKLRPVVQRVWSLVDKTLKLRCAIEEGGEDGVSFDVWLKEAKESLGEISEMVKDARTRLD